MSHVTTVKVKITSLPALKAACEQLGLEFRENQTTYKWYGHHVGDYPLPEGFAVSDLGHCEHAIGIPGNERAYEIGVVPNRDGTDGYTLLWDFFAGGYGLQSVVGQDADRLTQWYGVEFATEQMRQQGYSINAYETADGLVVVDCYQ